MVGPIQFAIAEFDHGSQYKIYFSQLYFSAGTGIGGLYGNSALGGLGGIYGSSGLYGSGLGGLG